MITIYQVGGGLKIEPRAEPERAIGVVAELAAAGGEPAVVAGDGTGGVAAGAHEERRDVPIAPELLAGEGDLVVGGFNIDGLGPCVSTLDGEAAVKRF